MYTYHNPILPGFHPDPSVLRDGEDFYLVNSTFEFFPGVPIYHSRNLVNWELAAYCLSRDSQLPLKGARPSGGIYAPTLRKHDGVYYMTTTNVTGGGNFIVHADAIRGPWSEPVWIKQGGIDPSLLWHDGKCYFCSTGFDKAAGKQGILLCEIDPLTGEQFTEGRFISYGSGGKCPEGPHIYFRDGWFYLMIAEGGTEYGHMETMSRSRTIYGPYEACPHNPILSQRDAQDAPIQCAGHADIFDDASGNWWIVCLGVRPLGHAMLHNLGRETFLAPLVWGSDGWPVAGKDGKIALEMEAPLPSEPKARRTDFEADFTSSSLAPDWNFVRNPERDRYTQGNGMLTIRGGEALSTPCGNPAFVGLRQDAFETKAEVTLIPPEKGRAGISAFYNENYHYDLFVERDGLGGKLQVALRKQIHDLEAEVYRETIPDCARISFLVRTDREWYRFGYRVGDGDDAGWTQAGKGSTAGLSTEGTMMMTFTGVYLGLFAEAGEGRFLSFRCKNTADA
jgi:alpha-N-arabinofuranosidase